jgi:hypothetical protein
LQSDFWARPQSAATPSPSPGVKPWPFRVAMILQAMDPRADRGKGPLRRCHCCGEARRDVGDDETCLVCYGRGW